MNKYEKGSCVFIDGWWFVVVYDDGHHIRCICDNANNSYTWNHNDVIFSLNTKESVLLGSGGVYNGYLPKQQIPDRKIPVDVIAEVLVGLHDHRWENFK